MLDFGRMIGPESGGGSTGGGGANGNALSASYTDRFGLSLLADANLAKKALITNGGTVDLVVVPPNQTIIVSSVWLYLTNTASSCDITLRHRLGTESDGLGMAYWGTTLGAGNRWTVLQIQKVLPSESVLSITASVNGVFNVNVDGILLETQ